MGTIDFFSKRKIIGENWEKFEDEWKRGKALGNKYVSIIRDEL